MLSRMFVRLKKAAVKVRDGERARQAERDGAIRAEQAAAERAKCEVTYYKVYKRAQGRRYAARKSRSKR